MMPMKSSIPSTILLALFIATPTVGEETHAQPPAQSPLQVLTSCLAAVESHDFEAYVDHLTPEAQRFQAGLALFFVTSASQAGDMGADPQTQLLILAMNDLVEEHSIPTDAQTPAEHAAEETRRQVSGQLLMQALAQAGMTSSPAVITSPQLIRQNCIKLAGVLKDCRCFLIAALRELSQPTQVSGAAEEETIKSIGLNEMAAVYRAVEWTLYTRGNYAMALASVPRETLPSSPDATASAPGSSNSTPSELRVDFRKMNGVWRINRIIPSPAVSPQISPANTSSPEIYRSDAPPVVPPAGHVHQFPR